MATQHLDDRSPGPVAHLLKIHLLGSAAASTMSSSTLRRSEPVHVMWEKIGMIDSVAIWPSMTATWTACPQCGEAARIKSIVPHPASEKEDRTFECQECGLPRTYTIELN
jgi:predicted RNA-binding Zn-ribbon protein involved in translation (DUF1610 family)